MATTRPLRARLSRVWRAVWLWARTTSPKVPRLWLTVDCGLVRATRRKSPRAYMHTEHEPRRVCVAREAAALSDEHLVGLFLHEIGHPMAARLYGRSEQEDADRAVKEVLGVTIEYKGPLLLEWVPGPVAERILKDAAGP